MNVVEWKSTSYEQQLQAGNQSEHSDGEVSGNNVDWVYIEQVKIKVL